MSNLQQRLLTITATHLIPASFLLLTTLARFCVQVLDCRRSVRSWSYSVSGLPDTPNKSPSHHSSWSAVSARHVLQILLSVAATLSTIVIYVEVNALLLVIIYILFIIATSLDIIGEAMYSLPS